MQKTTITRITGGLGAAALIGIGMLTNLPQTIAAQNQNQAPPADGRLGGPRRGGPGGPGGPGWPGGPGGRGGRMGGPMALGIDPRELSDTQREQIKAIHDRHADELKPIFDRLQAAHKALNENVLAGGNNLRALAIEVGNAEADAAFAQAEIQTEALAVLTPEQRQKMQDRQKEIEARRAEMEKQRQSRGAKPLQ